MIVIGLDLAYLHCFRRALHRLWWADVNEKTPTSVVWIEYETCTACVIVYHDVSVRERDVVCAWPLGCIRRGDVADKLYFIEDGCVEQMRTSTGAGVSVFVGRGGIVGEVGVLNGTYIGTAVASGRVETVWIAKDHLLNLLEECPTFAQVVSPVIRLT